MTTRPGTIQRAFELAHHSPLTTVEQIRKQLKSEGYGDWEEQLSGHHIRQQLRAIVWEKRRLLRDGGTLADSASRATT